MNERVVSDSGVIKVIIRALRDNSDEIPAGTAMWDRHLYLEAWRAGEVIAGVRNEVADHIPNQYEKEYWYSKCRMCMKYGLALGTFVGGRSSTTDYAFGAVQAVHLVLPDTINPKQALLLHTQVEAFGGEKAQQVALDWCREWAKEQRKVLVRFEDRYKGIPA
jgi:hypothetical protein